MPASIPRRQVEGKCEQPAAGAGETGAGYAIVAAWRTLHEALRAGNVAIVTAEGRMLTCHCSLIRQFGNACLSFARPASVT